MSKQPPLIQVYLLTPDDVQPERQALLRALDEGAENSALFALLSPTADPLSADVIIAVLWSQLDAPFTAPDGSEHESLTSWLVTRPTDARPRLLLYRGMMPLSPDSDLMEAIRVQAFFKAHTDRYIPFANMDGLAANVTEALRKLALELAPTPEPDTASDDSVPQDPAQQPLSTAPAAPNATFSRRDHYAHVQLPPNYVMRAELIDSLRDALLADGPGQMWALQGMGGIGKSTVARALCDDPQVQAAYPDGLLWITLGQEPSLIARLRELVAALGGVIRDSAPSLESLRVLLAELLGGRACLLILDDVWEAQHAAPFLDAARSALVTTRSPETVRALGAELLAVPGMSEVEAVALLDDWAGAQQAHTAPALKARIANRVGRVPLALKLAGAQLQHRSAVGWLETFDALRAEQADVYATLSHIFDHSLEALSATEQRLYAALAIFREDQVIHAVAIARLWAAMGGLDADAAAALIDKLAARALLERSGDAHTRAVVLHDLVRQFMDQTLSTEDVRQAHEALLRGYEDVLSAPGWHNGPSDGYFFDNLAYHLQAAGRRDELYALLTDSANWINAKFSACKGDASFLNDVDVALSDFSDPLSSTDFVTVAKLYAMRQIVDSRANRYDNDDFRVLVRIGRKDEAVIQNQVREPDDQVGGLASIYRALDDLGSADSLVLRQLIELVESNGDPYERALAYQTAITTLTDGTPYSPRKGLSSESRALLDRLIEAALAVPPTSAQVSLIWRLVNLIHWLELTEDYAREINTLLHTALTTARGLDNPFQKADAFMPLFETITVLKREDHAQDAFIDTVTSLRHYQFTLSYRVQSLRLLAGMCARLGWETRARELYIEASELARTDARSRDPMLRDIAAYSAAYYPDLSEELLPDIQDDYTRLVARFRATQSQLDNDRSPYLLESFADDADSITEHVRGFKDKRDTANTLRSMVSVRARYEEDDAPVDPLLEEIYRLAVLIDDPSPRNVEMRELASAAALEYRRFDIAIRAEEAIQNSPLDSINALLAIVTAILKTRQDDPDARVPYDIDSLLNKALDAAQEIGEIPTRDMSMRDIARAFARAGYVERAISIARMVEESNLVWSLSGVAVALSDYGQGGSDKLSELFDEVNRWFDHPFVPDTLNEHPVYVGGLSALATAFDQLGHESLADSLLDLAEEIAEVVLSEDFNRSANMRQLARLANAMSLAGREDTADALIDKLSNPYWKAQALRSKARVMIEEGDLEGLREMIGVQLKGSEYARQFRAELAVAMSQNGQIGEALKIARSLDRVNSAIALSRIAIACYDQGSAHPDEIMGLLDEIAGHVIETQGGANIARTMHALALALGHLGHDDAARTVMRGSAIYSEQRASIAQRDQVDLMLRRGEIDQALSLAREIKDVSWRASALGRVAAHDLSNAALMREADEAIEVAAAFARDDLVDALAANGHFKLALDKVGQCGIYNFIMLLAAILRHMDDPDPDFALHLLHSVVAVVKRRHTSWTHVERVFAQHNPPLSIQAQPLRVPAKTPPAPAQFPILSDTLRAALHHMVGRAYFEQKQYAESTREYEAAIQLNPDELLYHSNLALSYYMVTDYKKAIAQYTHLIAARGEDKQNVYDYYWRGLCYNAEEDYAAALADFDRTVEMEPKNGFNYMSRGRAQRNARHFPQALADFNRGMKLKPESAYIFYNDRALLYMEMRDFTRALEAVTEAMRLQPNNSVNYNTRGWIYFDQGDYDRAFEDFSTGVRINPLDSGNYNGRGWVYVQRGEYALAIEEFTKGVDSGPGGEKLNLNPRAAAYVDLGEYDKALADLERWMQADPETQIVADMMRAIIARLQGQHDAADAYLQAAHDAAQQVKLESMQQRRLCLWAAIRGDLETVKQYGTQSITTSNYFKASGLDLYLKQLARLFPAQPIYTEIYAWYHAAVMAAPVHNLPDDIDLDTYGLDALPEEDNDDKRPFDMDRFMSMLDDLKQRFSDMKEDENALKEDSDAERNPDDDASEEAAAESPGDATRREEVMASLLDQLDFLDDVSSSDDDTEDDTDEDTAPDDDPKGDD